LDYVTTKEGGGVELLWPFAATRLGLGWIGLSELPSLMPLSEILNALAIEFLLFMPLLVLILWLRKYAGKTTDMAEWLRAKSLS
jgi:hypothetical protein